MKFNKFFIAISYLTILSAFILIFILFYWYFYPYEPLTLTNVQLNKTKVIRGEHILVSADYCKKTDKKAEFFISFIDGVIYNAPPQVVDFEQGCHQATMSIYIPKALPAGGFRLRGIFRYKLNPIRTVEVNSLSKDFTIIK